MRIVNNICGKCGHARTSNEHQICKDRGAAYTRANRERNRESRERLKETRRERRELLRKEKYEGKFAYRDKLKAEEERIKKENLCLLCNTDRRLTDHKKCEEEYFLKEKKRKIREEEYREKRKSLGYCRSHTGVIALVNGNCKDCIFTKMAYRALGKGTRATGKILENILANQNNLCAYTGKILTIGENLSFDHKVPQWRGGTKTPENIHAIDGEINCKYKVTMSHQNFLDLAEATWKRRQKGEVLGKEDQVLAEIWDYQLIKDDKGC